ncbi:VWA domain-containing protein [Streptomyces sp. HC44]|uniref:VWA domain-containing protein n=1 Tax=Streptomyces scabichelini TaxID=2711217 RepID=A0A6G4VMH9_9ACTN|nr:VWA domain-containing protein [Streptomyces scabichelini]NGO14987.1 VWA domain-containing protein [Streptomyces scabichelini]
MGILNLLRNAFGKSRKGRTSEGADVPPAAEQTPPAEERAASVPAPATERTPAAAEPAASVPTPPAEPRTSGVDDLVSAAFDNVAVSAPVPAAREREPEAEVKPEVEAEPEVRAEPEVKAEPEIKAEPEVEAEPEIEAAAAPEPEPAAEKAPVVEEAPAAEPEPEPEVEAVTEVTPEPQPETAAEPEPVAETAPAPEPVAAEVAPEPEPVVADVSPEPEPEPEIVTAEAAPEPAPDAEPTPVTVQANEPAVADGDQAPQGPPAPDNETATGGAGGNEKAEGEAEAVKTSEPPAGGDPVPATLLTAYNAAATTLKNLNLTGTTAKVYLVLDRSASMRPYYKDGSAQALGEQALALATHLDPEAKVHVVFFSTELDGTGELTVTDHENKIDDLHAGLGRMGRTSYHTAVEAVLSHYEKSATTDPALVIFQTDGAPDARTPATQSLTDAAKNHPAVFFSFVAFGDPENKAFDYLRKLKTDNTAHFLAGETPLELTDQELYEGVLANWRP